VRLELIPVPVSTEIVVGQNRFLMNLIDATNTPLVSADRPVQLRFFDLAEDPATAKTETPGIYTPLVEGRPGLYRAAVNFDSAGDWGVEVETTEPNGGHRTGRTVFSVRDSGTTPAIGDLAIAVDTPTATTPAEIARISTDDHPDPDFYRLTITEAVDADKPFLLAFATPAFCQTQTCGPALDVVKSVATDYKDRVNFLHVEPYELKEVDGNLQPELSADNLPVPVPAVEEWGLPTEPYIFVVDESGAVTAKFEGVAGADELRAALEAVS